MYPRDSVQLKCCLLVVSFVMVGPRGSFAQICGVRRNDTVTKESVFTIANLIGSRILTVTAKDSDGLNYRPLIAAFVRLAFHSCLSRQCGSFVNLSDTNNNGLALVVQEVNNIVAFIRNNPKLSQLSKADVIALGGIVAVNIATGLPNGTSLVFRYGRIDECPADVDASQYVFPSRTSGINDVLNYFAQQFNFSAQETVAIMGAHTLGVVRDIGLSKILAKWTSKPDSLDNTYYAMLYNPGFLWTQQAIKYTAIPYRIYSFDALLSQPRVMLNCDMALLKNITVKNPQTGESTCTYTSCPYSSGTANWVRTYSIFNAIFVKDFVNVYQKMIEKGYDGNLLLPQDP